MKEKFQLNEVIYSICEYELCSIKYIKKRKHQRFHSDRCRKLAWEEKQGIKGLRNIKERIQKLENKIKILEEKGETK